MLDTVAQVRRALAGEVPLIGFSGSPFTLACYMVEGGASADFQHVKTMLYQRPDLLHRILDVNARAVTAYLNAQIEAGAQAVMIFDTWGGALGHAEYREFSLAYMQQVLDGLARERDGERVPNILFTKGGGAWLEAMAASGCDAVGIDWTVRPRQRRASASAIASRCRAISIRRCCSPKPATHTQRRGERARAITAAAAATSSISGTVFRGSHRRKTSRALVEAVHELARAYH